MNWTELNKFIHKDFVKPATTVGQTPIKMLNAKEDAHSIIHREVMRAIHIIESLALERFCQIIGYKAPIH